MNDKGYTNPQLLISAEELMRPTRRRFNLPCGCPTDT